MEFGLFSLPE